MSGHASSLRITTIDASHNCDSFDCGEPSVNSSLKYLFDQFDSSNSICAFTATDNNNLVHGFYFISTTHIEFDELPDKLFEKTEQYPIPAVKIELLAVDVLSRHKGLGARLLIDALQRIYHASMETGVMLVLVEVENERNRGFYLHYGFTPLSTGSTILFLPMQKLASLFKKKKIIA